ncbi:MAG: AEC family transporter [Chitinophagales bacterium]|nr:AEC family transporter [Chitinophagales bacterium]
MVNFVLIAFCIGAGMLFRRLQLIPKDAHKGINTWILSLALPAVSFKYLPNIQWSAEMLFPVASSILMWAGAWLFMEMYCRWKGYRQRSRSTLELASGFGNTSFVGFPLITAYYGEQALSIAILCDQSMFLLLSSIGVVAAVRGSRTGDGKVHPRAIVRRLLRFPPLMGCVLALVLSPFIDFSFAAPFFDKLAATVAPLALFSIGLQLSFKGWRRLLPQVSVALLYKLLIGPALVLAAAILSGIKGDIAKISVFEAAMPTVMTSSIICEQYGLNTRLVNLIIGISILTGLFSTALWYAVMR